MRALIIEPEGDRGTLAATRALAQAGWTVGVASSARRGLAGSSRYAALRHTVPGAQTGLDGFVEAVNAAIEEGAYEIVFCGGGDAEVTALSRCRERIRAQVPYPRHEAVLRALDKLELARAGERAGLEVASTSEADEASLRGWRLPCVVKARLHAPLADDGGPSRLEATVVADRAAARRRLDEIRALGGSPVLQELLGGRLTALACVADVDSKVIARVQQAAEGTWPPEMGVSARARTTTVDEALAERASALLGELGWFGLAQFQFLAAGDGRLKLIDFNGRFYGSMALAIAAGANLPAIWAALATGRALPPTTDARPGVRYQWIEGDLRRALAERRDGVASALLDCLRYSRGAVQSIWRRDDPGPALAAARTMLERAGVRLRSTARAQVHGHDGDDRDSRRA